MEKEKLSYKNLIFKKSVAIVGPAAYMMTSNLGNEIDKYDTVVRINRSIETVSTHSKDIGERTDILYSCLIEKPENAGNINVKDLKDNHKIKFICAPPASSFSGHASNTSLSDLVNSNTISKIKKEIPFRIVDHNLNNEISREINCRPNTGFLAIYDILKFKPSLLGIYGFSFYLDGFIKGTKSGSEMTEDDFANKCFNSKRHNQPSLWLYAKTTLRNRDDIKLDNVLEMILNMNSLEKEIFLKDSEGKNA